MTVQYIIAAGVVAAAIGFMIRSMLGRGRKKTCGSSGCGCDKGSLT